MPRPKPLLPEQAKKTLAHRFTRRADRLRQLATKFGIRPYRCWLVWSKFGLDPDNERGEGHERILARVEILPTPRVSDLTSVVLRQWSVGAVPEGSVRVDRISCGAYTEDVLRGLAIPSSARDVQPLPGRALRGKEGDVEFAQNVDFFWELVEDGRGDNPAIRRRFRLFGTPFRDAGMLHWVVYLQRASTDETRRGVPPDVGGVL